MKKIVLLAILTIILIACAPQLPIHNQIKNMSTEPESTVSEPVKSEPQNEQPQITAQEVSLPQENKTRSDATEVVQQNVSLKDLPKKEVVEGEKISFPNLRAVDPDGDPLRYTFSAPLNEKGEWQTREGDAGDHVVTITASDGVNVVNQQVLIVVSPKNKAPVIKIDDSIEALEGEKVVLTPEVSDPDGDEVTISYAGWMSSDTKDVSYNDSGLHKVVITASDGKTSASKEVIVSVKNVNRAPEFEDVNDIAIKEGERAIVRPSAKDSDGDAVRFTYESPLDASGVWTTKIGDAGEHELTITASDGDLQTEKKVKIIVEAVNRPPVIDMEDTLNATEGDTITLHPTITDPEGDDIQVVYAGWMSSATRETGYDDSGSHKVVITARDSNGAQSQKEVIIIVADKNRAPIFVSGSFN